VSSTQFIASALAEKNQRWIQKILPLLDAPEVLIPEINSVIKPWEHPINQAKAKVCIITPVEYSAAVANMGVAIIYDIWNNRYNKCVTERCYYPEPKLKKRMKKDKVLLHSKETCHPLREFDLLAFSSYYPLQMLAIPEMMEMSGMDVYVAKRKPEDPIVALAGVSAFNPAPVWDMVDCCFIGEGEEHARALTDIMIEEKSYGEGWKLRTLFRWTNELNGVYVPQFYKETYYPADDPKRPSHLKSHDALPHEEIRGMFGDDKRGQDLFDNVDNKKQARGTGAKPKKAGQKVPKRIKKAIFAVDEELPLTNMFVSNSEGQAMSAGSLMIANSCSNKCYFCQGSFISQPYRERSIEVLKAGFSDLIINTGAVAVTPYSFNLSDHSRVNEIVHWLMADADRKVSMSSQRIDYFSPDFARASFLSGNKSITLAIEGGSQRLRDKISKNLTEPMILDAFRTAFEVGFMKIKIYMIANLPEEEDEDRAAIVELARKIREVQIDVQGSKPFTQVRWSWTPFTSKNFTPLQWCKTLDCDPETGLPIMEKNLSDTVGGLRDFDYKFRVGTNSDLSIFNQCITHGDRRMSHVMMRIYNSSTLNYAGGMSIGKKPLEEVQVYLREMGLDFEYFLREKDVDEVFAWDHINILVTKRFLLDMYYRSKEAQNVAICFDDCTKCGACTPESVKHFNERKNNSIEPDITNVADALVFKPKKMVEKLRFKIRISKDFRYVHSSKIKMMLRRAALRCGLPTKNEVTLTSDKLKFQNWTAGVDYAEFALTDKVRDIKSSIEDMNRYLDLGIQQPGNLPVFPIVIEDAQVLSGTAAVFRKVFEKILYSISIPKKVIAHRVIEKALKDVLEAKKFTCRLRVAGQARDQWITIDHECRDSIHDMWTIDRGSHTEIRLLLSDLIGPYEILPKMFKTSKRRVLVYPVYKLDYFMKKDEGALDMFAGTCEECGEEIEQNAIGEFFSEDYCSRHVHLESSDSIKLLSESNVASVLETPLVTKVPVEVNLTMSVAV